MFAESSDFLYQKQPETWFFWVVIHPGEKLHACLCRHIVGFLSSWPKKLQDIFFFSTLYKKKIIKASIVYFLTYFDSFWKNRYLENTWKDLKVVNWEFSIIVSGAEENKSELWLDNQVLN